MELSAYKRLHEAWMSNNTGSTIEESVWAVLPLVFAIFINCYLSKKRSFLFDYLSLVIPATLNFTLLAYKLKALPFTLAVLSLIFWFYQSRKNNAVYNNIFVRSYDKKPPWITNFRSATNLLTIICILAVDLNIFPRKFAKTETFGYGVMDLGVGFYVFCNGLVHKRDTFNKQLTSVFVLVALGFIRLVSVISIEYHEYVTEYGVHWNFFFTLAACKFVTAMWSHSLEIGYFSMALIMGIVQHLILTSGVQSWVLSLNARDDFIEANREGLSSILGYVSIYYAAAAYRDNILGLSNLKALRNTLVFLFVTWFGTIGLEKSIGVSRRLCNLGYIFWVLAVAFLMILILLSVDIALISIRKPRVPQLFNAINRYGLLFFLLGNILTGLININLQTLILPTYLSYSVLFLYLFLVTGVTYFLDKS